MITDEKRREVAEKMREICRENPDVSLQTMVASVMNECLPKGRSTVRRLPTLSTVASATTSTTRANVAHVATASNAPFAAIGSRMRSITT